MPVDSIKRKEIMARFFANHPNYSREQYLKHKNTTRKKYLEENKEIIRLKKLEYRAKNRDVLNARNRDRKKNLAYWEKRYIKSLSKANLNGAEIIDKYSISAFYKRVFTQDAAICDYCRGVFPIRDIVIDHKQPYAKGGIHVVTNLSVSCNPCNQHKNARAYDTWISMTRNKVEDSA